MPGRAERISLPMGPVCRHISRTESNDRYLRHKLNPGSAARLGQQVAADRSFLLARGADRLNRHGSLTNLAESEDPATVAALAVQSSMPAAAVHLQPLRRQLTCAPTIATAAPPYESNLPIHNLRAIPIDWLNCQDPALLLEALVLYAAYCHRP